MHDIRKIIAWVNSLPEQKALFNQYVSPDSGSPSLKGNSHSALQRAHSTSEESSPVSEKIMRMGLDDPGVEFQLLQKVYSVPKAAKTLVHVMDDVDKGIGILPDALKPSIKHKLTGDECEYWRWESVFRPPGKVDNLPGRIPSVEEVKKIFRNALECMIFDHEEASWRSQIHLRLLELIFDNAFDGPCGQFNALLCTTARPHPGFEPTTTTHKMIDICIYASLDKKQALKAAAVEFCETSPTGSINHTDFMPIQHRPLLLSIVTIKPWDGWRKPKMQLGVWHASQWAFLRWAVGERLLRRRRAQGVDVPLTDEEEGELEAEKLAVLSKLGFIPGILVCGNEWHLVLSTYSYKDRMTTLWGEAKFGVTRSISGIYSIVAGIRQLTAWARDTYLPWFEENILT